MPEVQEFLEGFNLIQGRNFSNYQLIKVNASHEAVVRYSHYKYQITLEFQAIPGKSSSYANLFNAVVDEIEQTHIIYGVRNPYSCSIDYPKEGDIIELIPQTHYIFHLIGHSYRTTHIPHPSY